jgi:hypothetical protein
MKLSMILGVCGLIGAALLVYLFYILFRGEKL